jgi:UDP-N-acetylmuramate dehydrogenase
MKILLVHFLKTCFLNILFFVITFNISGDTSCEVLYGVSLKNYTTFKVGGNASVFLLPHDVKAFVSVLEEVKKTGNKWFVLGGGSNIVPPDEGFDGIVICTSRLKNISICDDKLLCECGASMQNILEYCIEHSLSGLEKFAGLPGTCGGAAFMNARCYEKSISDVLLGVKYCACGKIFDYKMKPEDWAYKKSPFQGMLQNDLNPVVLSVIFDVSAGTKEKILSDSEVYLQDREKKGHFKYPSAGSVFKNNHAFGKPSGKIIDECGLRGISCGGARIAPWHGNFIINEADASAQDIKNLVNLVKKTVKEKTGFELESEIIFL